MSRLALLAVADVRVRALCAGVLLGVLVHALAAQRESGAFGLAMALVMVVAGSISFVLHALATSGTRGSQAVERMRALVVALGLGLVGGVQGLAFFNG